MPSGSRASASGSRRRAAPLPGELDRNFALRRAGHVLKLHAPGTDPELLDLQDAAMEHVAARSLAIADAAAACARATRRRAVDAGARLARVLTWLPGTPWAGSRDRTTPETLREPRPRGRRARRRAGGLRAPARSTGRCAGTCSRAGELRGDATPATRRGRCSTRFAGRRPARACASSRRRRSTTTRTSTTCWSATTAGLRADRLRRPLPRAARVRPRGRLRVRDGRAARARARGAAARRRLPRGRAAGAARSSRCCPT